MDSLVILYQSHYEVLIKQRANIIAELEEINKQIKELMYEAKTKNVIIDKIILQ